MTSGQDVAFELHQPADGGDEVGQLIVALLEDDVDVRPCLVDPLSERDDRVVAGQDDEGADRDQKPDGEGGGGLRGAHEPTPLRLTAKTIADPMARIAPSSPSTKRSWPRPTTFPGSP